MTWPGRAAGGDGGEAPHALVLYDSEQSLCARAVPYLRGGVDRGEAVLAVVSAGVQQILRSALGDDATRVRWQADDLSYRRLGAMFEGFRRFLADQRAAGVAMRLLAQNDTLGAPERVAAYVRFEAMANEVYRPYGYRWACLYDTRDYTAQTLRQVRQVHPQLLQPAGRARRNGQYLEPSRYVTQAEPLVRPPAAVQLDFEVTDPGELLWGRRLLRGWAEIRGMGGEDTDDVLIAIGEAVTNAVEHGTPPVRVRAWTADGLARVHVHDHGTTPIPATAGYRRPHHEFDRGYGLWVARQLADVVTTYSDPAGTTIALDFPLTPTGNKRPQGYRRGQTGRWTECAHARRRSSDRSTARRASDAEQHLKHAGGRVCARPARDKSQRLPPEPRTDTPGL